MGLLLTVGVTRLYALSSKSSSPPFSQTDCVKLKAVKAALEASKNIDFNIVRRSHLSMVSCNLLKNPRTFPLPFQAYNYIFRGSLRPNIRSEKDRDTSQLESKVPTDGILSGPVEKNVLRSDFSISLTVTANQEKVFTGEQVKEFAKTYAFEIIYSTPRVDHTL
ncbi:hypothetical protein ACFE04_021063 [Oxalis oulophora]